MPVGLAPEDVPKVDLLAADKIRLKKGERLFDMGQSLNAIYAIRFGTLKTHVTMEDGRNQITGFHFPGEVVGMDAIGEQKHVSDATALEDSEVCVLNYQQLEDLSRQIPSLQSHFNRMMSREITRDHQMLLTLGSMRAEERLATFLLNLSHRFAARGYSSSEFVLRMSREEIGSYLGLKLETVSRLFSRFAEVGLLQIKQRHVKIVDVNGLRELVHQAHC